MTTITVRTRDLPPHIAAHVGVATVEVRICDSVEILSQQWSEGSRDQYHVAALSGGDVKPVHDPRPWPQNMSPLGRTEIASGCIVIRTGTFCGKPATPYIYARSADIAPAIEAQEVALTHTQAQVLKAIATLNSGGKKRFREDKRMSQAVWDSTVETLQGLGLVDNRKSATVEGRNRSRSISDFVLNPYSETFFAA